MCRFKANEVIKPMACGSKLHVRDFLDVILQTYLLRWEVLFGSAKHISVYVVA